MIIVPTIPATGTHFLLDLLGIEKPDGMLWKHNVMYGHIYPDKKDIYLPLIKDNQTLIPLRHPFAVAQSWAQRGMNFLELIDMWELLINEIDPLDPVYLPIDSPDREHHLREFNNKTGLNFETSWQPVASKNSNYDVDYTEPPAILGYTEVSEMVDRNAAFFARFYP